MFGLKQQLLNFVSRRYHLRQLRKELRQPLSFDELRQMETSRDEKYFYCVRFFERFLPARVRAHRHYFAQSGRGFGEEAFHAMWFLLFEKFRPRTALEIGVYRGQTITLWKLLSQYFGFECRINCVSPFTSTGDSVSQYQNHADYYEDTLLNHRLFGLQFPTFCRELSTSPEAEAFISKERWDVIYIDGNHDYDVVKHDWNLCSQVVLLNGIIVLDDSALDTDYRPPCFATAGHPGPSRVAKEIDTARFREILAVGHNRVFQRSK